MYTIFCKTAIQFLSVAAGMDKYMRIGTTDNVIDLLLIIRL